MAVIKRTEVRLMRVLTEYTIPDEMGNGEANALLTEYNEPDELPYPKRFIHIDKDDTLLFSVITMERTKKHAEYTEETYVQFIESLVLGKTDLEKVAEVIAVEDMREVFQDHIKDRINFEATTFFKEKVQERKAFLIERWTKAAETLITNEPDIH